MLGVTSIALGVLVAILERINSLEAQQQAGFKGKSKQPNCRSLCERPNGAAVCSLGSYPCTLQAQAVWGSSPAAASTT